MVKGHEIESDNDEEVHGDGHDEEVHGDGHDEVNVEDNEWKVRLK